MTDSYGGCLEVVEKQPKLQLALDLEGAAASTVGLVNDNYSFAVSHGMAVLISEIAGNLVRMPEDGERQSGMIVDCNLARWGVLHLLALDLTSSMNG